MFNFFLKKIQKVSHGVEKKSVRVQLQNASSLKSAVTLDFILSITATFEPWSQYLSRYFNITEEWRGFFNALIKI